MSNEQYDDVFRGKLDCIEVVLLGDSGVGKTHMIQSFGKENPNIKIIGPTLGVEYSTKLITLSDNKRIKIQIWDTAGQQQYRSITMDQLRKALGSLIVFDITNHRSFDNVRYWIELLRERAVENVQIVLVGNKIDRSKERVVSREEAQKMAQTWNLSYRETCVSDIKSLRAVFSELAQKISRTKLSNEAYTSKEERINLRTDLDKNVQGDENIVQKKNCC